jgi:uncharacterized membrane protein YraQ (UPF0718 family)
MLTKAQGSPMSSEIVLVDVPSRRSWPSLGWLVYLPLTALLWLGSGLGVPPTLASLTPRVQGLITIFLGIFIEALPFVVAGVIVSTLIAMFVSDRAVQRITPTTPGRAAIAGSLLGLLFPVCECGTVPTTRRLLHKGAPLPFGVGFLLAAPVINPVVIIATYVAFSGDWLIVGGRIGLTLVIAVVVALVLAKLPNQARLLAPRSLHLHDDHAHAECGCAEHTHERSFGGFVRHSSEEFIDMVRWLVVGALLAATMQTFIPQSTLLAIGDGPLVSVLVLMALAVVLSVCSTVDAFLALALSTTFGPGALLAFLVFGPMIDIKSSLMFLTTLSARAVTLIIGLVTPIVIAAGVLINLLVR